MHSVVFLHFFLTFHAHICIFNAAVFLYEVKKAVENTECFEGIYHIPLSIASLCVKALLRVWHLSVDWQRL